MSTPDELPPVIRALLSPQAYDHPVGSPITLIQTHVSYVLLAGEYAYKIKKPLNLGFLDYSTLAQRLHMCEEEVRLNRRLCKEAYLGVAGITATADGFRIEAEPAGRPVEYAVKMRRMPADRMMQSLIAEDRIDLADVRALARLLAAFHERSETNEYVASFGRPDALRENWHENFSQVAPFVGSTISRQDYDELRRYADTTMSQRASLFHRRADARRVRDCHGDLRSDSVVIHEDGSICVMDCIEFNDRIRYGDVAGDIAFLAMDLEYRGRRDLSDELLAAYLSSLRDESLTLVLRFYKCYRAYVRGKVESLTIDERDVPPEQRAAARSRAIAYFSLASEYASSPRKKTLAVLVGLTGSGKSFLANAIGARFEAAIISSDAVRDEISSRGDTLDAYASGRYAEGQRASVYEAMRQRAESYLRDGYSAILDATHVSRHERVRAYELASRTGAELVVVAVEADEDVTRRHLEDRASSGDTASEGRWEIYVQQRDAFEPIEEAVPGAFIDVDGGADVNVNVELIVDSLG